MSSRYRSTEANELARWKSSGNITDAIITLTTTSAGEAAGNTKSDAPTTRAARISTRHESLIVRFDARGEVMYMSIVASCKNSTTAR